jgi:hypothetical protein
MKQSQLKKPRICKLCRRSIYGDAAALKDHIDDHKLAERMQKSGLVIPERGIIYAAR